MKPRLVGISGPLRGTLCELVDGPLSIGRQESNELCLLDPAVSRKHCTIQQTNGHFELVDLDSRNGSFVNGIPVRRKVLEHGDAIHVGHCELVFLISEEEDGESLSLRPVEEPPPLTTQTIQIDPASLSGRVTRGGVEVGRMARDLTALFRVTNIINSIRDLALLQRELLQLIFEVVPAEQGAIVLRTDRNNDEGSICNWSRKEGNKQPLRIQRSLVHRALWERSAVFTDVGCDPQDPCNVLCVPLIAAERTLGVIYLTASHPVSPFLEDHIHFLGSVSRIAAVTIENRLALNALSSENEALKEQIHTSRLVGESRQIRQVEEFITRVARGDTTVLVRGESGTGKELVARAIHHQSPRSARPFVAINCAAIPEALLESELFGHERGAFTGAVAAKKGKLEAAEDGTLFLDEIGELAPALQAKLLRVLQQREFERLGGTRTVAFTARVVTATNRNLEQAIKSGDFRQDLYYRLNVVSVTVPPLRERREDIPLLALFFAAKYAEKSRRPFKGISREARTLLMNYSWPGNVRELENAIEHAIVLGLTEEILPEDLPASILEEQSSGPETARYYAVLNNTKKELILGALREANGNYPEAARLLGIHPKYLHRLMRTLNLKSKIR